jgi:glycosyltransferase involved in cell wall biosynthesis
MRVAIVHDWLLAMRGGEKCLEVFCELFPDADLYTLIYSPDCVSPTIRSMRVHPSWMNRLPGIRTYYRYCLPLFPRIVEAFPLTGYDLILSSSHCVAKGILAPGALHIAYMHSPMRYIWDQYEAYFERPGALWFSKQGMALWRTYLQQWDVRSSERVDFFIANSNNVAAKIKKLYGREAIVIHPPLELGRFYMVEEQQPYYLIVSALVPYKQIDLAIHAFNDLQLPLKIVGDGPLRKKLEKIAQPNVEFIGWVSDDILPRLYASCQALIFPGEEDFGIVPLEAQGSGRPVIAYGRGGVLETVLSLDSQHKDLSSTYTSTGVFFHESTADSLQKAVRYFQDNQHRFKPAAIRQHAARFSRERFKTQMRDYIDARTQRRTLVTGC